MKLTREHVRAVYVNDLVNQLSIEFGWPEEDDTKRWLDVDFVDGEDLARGAKETTIHAPEVLAQLSSAIDAAIEAANAANVTDHKEMSGG